MSIDDLISESQQRAAADPSWLGSEDHLALLSSRLEGLGVSDVTLVWGPSGRASNWNHANRTIELEAPVVSQWTTPEAVARATVLGLVHEALHAEFSTPTSITRQLAKTQQPYRRSLETMFNILEDGRLGRLAAEHWPDALAAVETHATESVDQLAATTGTDASGIAPSRPNNQLFYAVMAYALTPGKTLVVHPAVEQELTQLRPIVDRARDAGATQACVPAAADLVRRISAFRA